MLGLRAEVRQSRGDVKPRNLRWRCQKTTTIEARRCGEYRQLPELFYSNLETRLAFYR